MGRKFLFDTIPALSATIVAVATAIGVPALAQTAPLVETRGVWFATVLGDGGWPAFAGDSPQNQEADLRARIREALNLGLNTFVFQAVARGDAMYASDRVPWSARLNGAGQDPGFDPLLVAVDECHRLGIELHAWINVFRIGDENTVTVFEGLSSPGHVFYEHPEWVATYDGQLWLDPSSPEARTWMVANVMEIVNEYDVDAVHFDFIRYPTGGLTDDLANFQFDPRGFVDIDDWRRDNITLFVNEISAAVAAAKPWVKVGSTPFGNYQNFDGAWPAAWGYSDVFQESRRWLAEGTNDYLAPQIYFDIGRQPEPPSTFDSPDFAYLVDEWVAQSSNRPIFIGHGPYKSVVLQELNTQIDRARSGGAAGQIFFRFDHIRQFDFSVSYPTPALPAPMPHRFEASAPATPADPLVTAESEGPDSTRFVLSWQRPDYTVADPLRGYAVFAASDRDPVVNDAADYAGFVPAGGLSFDETLSNAEVGARRFALASVSRLGMRSAPSAIVEGVAVGRDVLAIPDRDLRIAALWPQPASSTMNIQIEADWSLTGGYDGAATYSILDVTGRTISRHTAHLQHSASTTLRVDLSGLPSGVYLLTVATESEVAAKRFVVVR